jgi:hypothetical protein
MLNSSSRDEHRVAVIGRQAMCEAIQALVPPERAALVAAVATAGLFADLLSVSPALASDVVGAVNEQLATASVRAAISTRLTPRRPAARIVATGQPRSRDRSDDDPAQGARDHRHHLAVRRATLLAAAR